MRSRENSPLRKPEFCRSPFGAPRTEAGRYDVAFGTCVFHHIDHAQRVALLSRMRRVSRDDGVVVLRLLEHWHTWLPLGGECYAIAHEPAPRPGRSCSSTGEHDLSWFGRDARTRPRPSRNTAFAYAIYAGLAYLGVDDVIPNDVAILLGILFSFKTQGVLVFRNAPNRRLLRFVFAWSLMSAVDLLLIKDFLTLGFDRYGAGALAVAFVAVLACLAQKFSVLHTAASWTFE